MRWSSKEALLVDALSLRMARVTDADTGTLAGGAMMHALTTPPDHRASLTRDIRALAEALVSFLLRAVSASLPAADSGCLGLSPVS